MRSVLERDRRRQSGQLYGSVTVPAVRHNQRARLYSDLKLQLMSPQAASPRPAIAVNGQRGTPVSVDGVQSLNARRG